MQETGKKRHWEDVDFDAMNEKFAMAAEKGRQAKLQPKTRVETKKSHVAEAMKAMKERQKNPSSKEKDVQK